MATEKEEHQNVEDGDRTYILLGKSLNFKPHLSSFSVEALALKKKKRES